LKRVLLFATTTGYQTRTFGEAAERLGVELVFATDRCHVIDDPWRDSAIPIRFYDEDASVQAIVESAASRAIDGVLAVGDRPTVIAARVARALGLPWHSVEGAEIARHKVRTRERLRDVGLPVPWFEAFSIDSRHQPSTISLDRFPCVVKPVALSASRGVIRADDLDSLCAATARLRALLQTPGIRAERNDAHDTIIVEGFIPGREYAVEAVLHHGAMHVLAIFDKPDPLDGPFFEETIYVTPPDLPSAAQDQIVQAVARAAEAIGLCHGPIHAECRVNRSGVFVLEVAARPIGGLCARALRFQTAVGTVQTAISLEELLLRQALGESPAGWRRESCAAGVMMIPIPRRGVFRDVEGVDDARRVAHVEDVRITAKPQQVLEPLPEGASYLGFIFARADGPGAAERALRDAHRRLRFTVNPELPVRPSA
jgi:biotin carboxylase